MLFWFGLPKDPALAKTHVSNNLVPIRLTDGPLPFPPRITKLIEDSIAKRGPRGGDRNG
jgi:hypothetical protein